MEQIFRIQEKWPSKLHKPQSHSTLNIIYNGKRCSSPNSFLLLKQCCFPFDISEKLLLAQSIRTLYLWHKKLLKRTCFHRKISRMALKSFSPCHSCSLGPLSWLSCDRLKLKREGIDEPNTEGRGLAQHYVDIPLPTLDIRCHLEQLAFQSYSKRASRKQRFKEQEDKDILHSGEEQGPSNTGIWLQLYCSSLKPTPGFNIQSSGQTLKDHSRFFSVFTGNKAWTISALAN